METSRASSEQSLRTLSSTSNSDASINNPECHPSIETRICLVGAITDVDQLKTMLQQLKIPYIHSATGEEFTNEDPQHETIFILNEFEGDLFNKLKKSDNRILGPPVIRAIAATNEPLPYTSRPLYCTCMQGLNLCFTNFKTKEHLAHLVTLCHYMGACIRRDMSSKIDYLVTNTLHGPKYRTAVSLGTPVMKEEWIHKCWAARNKSKMYLATDDEFLVPCKSKPFEGCAISFLGFAEQEKKHMEEQAQQQGGECVEVGSATCTHLVVDENAVTSLPFEPKGKLYVVVQEWFWGSIQIEAKAAESMYIFRRAETAHMMTRSSTTSSLLGTPKWRGSTNTLGTKTRSSTGKRSFSRKRSRLREETLAKLAQDSDNPSTSQVPPRKRPSTDTSACLPDSMLDMSGNTTTPSVMSPQTPEKFHRELSSCSRLRSGRRSSYARKTRRSSEPHFAVTSRKNSPAAVLNSQANNMSLRISGRESYFSPLKESPLEARLSRKRKSSELTEAEDLRPQTPGSVFKTPLGVPPRKKSSSSNRQSPVVHRDPDLSNQAKLKPRNVPRTTGAIRRLSLFASGQRHAAETSSFDKKDSEEVESASLALPGNEQNSTAASGSVQTESERTSGDIVAPPKAVPVSARYQVVAELLQTEKNYVGILQTILNLFKKPLDNPNQAGGPILASEDMKAIFSSLPDIESVHRAMSDDLQSTVDDWNEASCVGQLILNYAEEIGRCYPPFVNFFEVSVDTIGRCESRSPRFHAFLKINQAKRECGRQTLAELLINPVQRVPRIILLLQDIKKHTERENASHPDVTSIQSSIDALKEVMTHINEDKRKTESQRQIFDIVYEVDGCPPTIVSSHRQFVARAELIAVDDNLCNKGDHISLFVFSDCVEIAKRRRGMKSNSFKSPNVHAARATSAVRCLKHVKLMSLSHIKKVVNIKDSEECQNAVALYCRTPIDTQDWLYTFKVLCCSEDGTVTQKEGQASGNKENAADSCGKGRLLRLLAKHRANTVCKAVDENFVCSVNPHELDVCTADLGSTLGRAVRAAKKSSRKLTRAFSFTRTPRRVVQRAVNNMLSPSQQLPPSGLAQEDTSSADLMDTDDSASQVSGLTPSMSVSSLCTPHRDRHGNRLPSTSSLQQYEDEDEDVPPPLRCRSNLKPSVSTMTLARPPTKADLADFPAMPTPPTRRRKINPIKAATVAFGRSSSFRRRRRIETAL